MINNRASLYWWLPLISLCLLAYWLQLNSYIHQDVAIIYHTAALMLQGETYAQGIIEPNPPMIFYLNFLPIMIASVLNLKMITAFRLYVLILIFISIASSHYLFKKIFQSDIKLIYLMSYVLSFVLLFLPIGEFGQREHFLLILTMPYILLAAYRLENFLPIRLQYKNIMPTSRGIQAGGLCRNRIDRENLNKKNISIPTLFAILIGVMAGIGFAIKPYFLTTLLFIELLFIYSTKNIVGWLRMESSITTLVILIYGVSVLILYPAYLNIIVPLWMPFYISRMSSWLILLSEPNFIFCGAAIALSYLTRKEARYRSFNRLLAFTIIGYIITFLIPRANWYYHLFPALGMTCLYFTLVIGELFQKASESTIRFKDWCIIGGLGLLLSLTPLYLCIFSTKKLMADFHSDNPMHQLTTFMNQHTPNNSYNFFSVMHKLNILEFYSTARYKGSFPFFWEFNRLKPGRFSKAMLKKNLIYVLNIVADDLNEKQPKFVIIDTLASKDYLHEAIDYAREYSRHKPFRKAWSHYEYMTSIKPYDIYQRRDSA